MINTCVSNEYQNRAFVKAAAKGPVQKQHSVGLFFRSFQVRIHFEFMAINCYAAGSSSTEHKNLVSVLPKAAVTFFFLVSTRVYNNYGSKTLFELDRLMLILQLAYLDTSSCKVYIGYHTHGSSP